MVSQLNKAGTLTAADLIPSRKPLEKSDSSALSFLATDNNPPNDDKQRGAGRRNDDANERDLGNCGELPRMERYDGVQGEEGGRGWRESEQITEVYEYMSEETGTTEMEEDEVVKDKERVLIPIEKQKKVSEVEEEHI